MVGCRVLVGGAEAALTALVLGAVLAARPDLLANADVLPCHRDRVRGSGGMAGQVTSNRYMFVMMQIGMWVRVLCPLYSR